MAVKKSSLKPKPKAKPQDYFLRGEGDPTTPKVTKPAKKAAPPPPKKPKATATGMSPRGQPDPTRKPTGMPPKPRPTPNPTATPTPRRVDMSRTRKRKMGHAPWTNKAAQQKTKK